ncbi:hypothetical protein BOX15_Mlig014142g1, partial [Macrostomum lignano]
PRRNATSHLNLVKRATKQQQQQQAMELNRSDLNEDVRRAIQAIVNEVCSVHKDEDAAAQNIKRKLDGQLGSTWHVIVGRSYACHVGHEKNTFGVFKSDNLNIVVFKAGL